MFYTLKEAAEQFLNGLQNPKTQATYQAGLRALALSLEDDGNGSEIHTFELDNGILEAFYYWLVDSDLHEAPYSSQTVRTYLYAVRSFLEWLSLHDRLSPGFQLPKAVAQLKAARRSRKAPYKHRQIDPDLAAIVGYYDKLQLPSGEGWQIRRDRLVLLRNRAIVHTLYATAGRVSEVASLTRALVFDGRADEVQLVGKGSQTRVLLLTAEAKRAIRAYLRERTDGDPALFISHGRTGGGRSAALSVHSIWRTVKDAARILDLHKTTSPHSFRHFRASQLLNEGMPLESVQAYLGHQDIATTRKVYAHTKTAVLKDQLATFGLSAEEALKARE